MSLRTFIYTRAILPATSPAARGVARHLADLRRLEKASVEENLQRQWAAVGRLLQHAFEHCPFYRRRFDEAGLTPAAIRHPDDLTRLPVLTRAEVRANLAGLCSDAYRPEQLLASASGGTTDMPVPLMREPATLPRRMANQQRFWEWAGAGPGSKVFWLWGAQNDFSLHPSWRWHLYDRYLMRRVWAPTAPLNPDVFERYRQQLNRFRPDAIMAYPTPLFLLCEYLRDCGRPVHSPKAVVSTAEALLPHQRALIESVLACKVFEHYGSRDAGMVAAECEAHEGFHSQPHASYLEFSPLQPGANPDGVSEILLTDLTNYGMPLIRYRIGDCVAGAAPAGACPCGRGLPRMPTVTGRTTDTFRLPNGSLVPGVVLACRMTQEAPGLAKIQVVQETLREFRLRYVPGPGFSSGDLEPLQRKLDEFLGVGLDWHFEAVPDLPREKSGKTRCCISHVPAVAPADLAAGKTA